MNLTDLLSGSVISSIAGQTGTSEKDTQNVLANALPALVGAMAQNASTEDGANSLAKALDDHTSSKGLASLLQNVDTEDGTKILTKILGGETETVQNAVAKKSGASKVDTSKILAMAAPLLLAALGSQKKKTKTQSDGLGGLLTSLLGGGDDDEDDGSTLISLAGSLLGGSNKKSGKSDSGDILTSLAGGLLTSALGLSLSLGAFLAGLLLARSQYSMSVISGILPYRDVFMSLFFISVGMMLNVDFFGQHFFSIILSTLLFIAIKSLLTLPAVLIQGYPLRAAIITSLSLAQVGEFAFVLAASGLEAGLFDMTAYQNFLAVSVLTMMLTPGLIAIAPRLANRVAGWRNEKQLEDAKESSSESCPLEDHLIIVGFGISGKHLAHVAHESGIPYTILEMNPETVHRYHGKEPISHGDATQPVVLEHLGVEKARVLAIIISDPAAVRAITIEARRLNPNLYIVARTRFVTEVAPLRRLGANDVIAEEFETSIEVFSRVLTQYLVPRQDIDAFAARIRQMNYRMIRRMSNAVDPLDEVVSRLPDMGVQAMRLGADSPLCGLPLSRSGLRPKYGVTVVAIHRQGEIHASPEPQSCLEADDIIYLFGRTDKLYAVKPLFSGSLKENAAPSKSAEASI